MALDTIQFPQQKMLATAQRLQQQHQNRTIAPAPPATISHNSGRLFLPYARPPGYINPKGTTLESNNPSVVRRNARERNRVKQVNNGFVHLRQHIPQAIVADLSNGRRGGTGPGASKKLSKVDTLRMALEYIRRLQRVIEEVDQSDASSVSSYGTACSTASASPSPPPSSSTVAAAAHFASAHYYQPQQFQSTYNSLSYAGSFQPQPEQMLISPAASVSSSTYSGDSYSSHNDDAANTVSFGEIQLKYEQTASYEEYHRQHNYSTNEDEELLDYITLWQEEI